MLRGRREKNGVVLMFQDKKEKRNGKGKFIRSENSSSNSKLGWVMTKRCNMILKE